MPQLLLAAVDSKYGEDLIVKSMVDDLLSLVGRDRWGIGNVIKTDPVVDPSKSVGHWVNGRTEWSLVGPHDP